MESGFFMLCDIGYSHMVTEGVNKSVNSVTLTLLGTYYTMLYYSLIAHVSFCIVLYCSVLYWNKQMRAKLASH